MADEFAGSLAPMLTALSLLLAVRDDPVVRVGILSLGRVEAAQIQAVKKGISRQFKAETVTLKPRAMPPSAYYKTRNRYRADRLLEYLDHNAKGFDKVIAVTKRDISTTHRGHYDWGVVGLGRLGGYSCVVSSFRLSKKGAVAPLERLRRSATHEIGHTFGLDHCPMPTCVMLDGGGKLEMMDRAGPLLCRRCRTLVRPISAVR